MHHGESAAQKCQNTIFLYLCNLVKYAELCLKINLNFENFTMPDQIGPVNIEHFIASLKLSSTGFCSTTVNSQCAPRINKVYVTEENKATCAHQTNLSVNLTIWQC